MAEFSGWWTTTATPAIGSHQVDGYTQTHVGRAAEILAGCANFEGVAAGYWNKLAGTVTGANTVSINTGGAVVDGRWYYNDAPAAINIPSSNVGTERIDRIVLRCYTPTYYVKLYRIPGTNAASPTAPALTTSPGGTYDIPLYQARVNLNGTVTLTDERMFAKTKSILADSRQGEVTD